MTLDQYPVKKITTHVIDSLNQLLAQYLQTVPFVYDNKNNVVLDNEFNPVLDGPIGKVAGRIFIFGQYIQREELIKWALFTQTNLAAAQGATLDRWGILLNVTRSGLADTEYLQILKLQIVEYTSQGGIEILIQVTKIVTGTLKVILQENFPAKFQITALGGQPIVPVASISTIIGQTKAGGVGFKVALAPLNAFGFLGNPLAKGFSALNNSDVNLQIGGQFAGFIS